MIANRIGRHLETAGYEVVLQQWDFANVNFIDAMHGALASGARVVGLLSPAYLESDYCAAEWQNAIAGDPLNRHRRLVVLRVADCAPTGLLAGIAYWDLVPHLHDDAKLGEMVRQAVAPPEHAAEAGWSAGTPAPGLPQGIVAFVFAELGRSVDRREAAETLRTVAEANGGRYFRSGESHAAAFERPHAALRAALDVTARVEGAGLVLHCGEAELFENVYVGTQVRRAALLLTIVAPGQVLLSGAAAELLDGGVPDVALRDMGYHRLGDLPDAERIVVVVAPGLRTDLPESLGVTNNLPVQSSRLIARDAVVKEVRDLTGEHRVVTLVGPGGVGKTRIAIQVGILHLEGAFEGVWFVDFAPLGEPGRVAGAVCAALGLREMRGDDGSKALVAYLKARSLFLILDNCEHVIGEAARLVAEIARHCPGVRVLATSREALGIGGECTFRTLPLSVPEAGRRVTAATAPSYGAIAWFAERGFLADNRFAITDENAETVAEICRRLDGLPLAIELAAARVSALTVRDIERRIDRRFKLLQDGSREALPRQKTLRALIDWSHDLLSPAEQALLRRLAIFAGGWTLEAAEAVCADATLDESDVLDLLTQLVGKSLVVADLHDGTARYRFLETMRAYALEKLSASGEEADLERRRLAWVASFAERTYASSWSNADVNWATVMFPELENVRAALRRALGPEPDVERAGIIAGSLAAVWQARALGEGRRAIERVLQLWAPAYAPRVEALVWLALAALTVATRRVEAAERALNLYESLGDRIGSAGAMLLRAEGLRQTARLDVAQAAVAEALAAFRELNLESSSHYPTLLQTHASILADAGRADEARAVCDEALRRFEAVGNEREVASVQLLRAELECSCGNLEAALALTEACIRSCERLGDVVKQALLECNAAAYHLFAGNVAGARAAAQAALELGTFGEVGLYVVFATQHLATAAALSGDTRRGGLLFGYVDRWYRDEGFERELTEQRAYDIGMEALRRGLAEEPLAALLRTGAELTKEAALAEARSIK